MKDLTVVNTIIVNAQEIQFKTDGEEIFTDSLTVARVFGKRHDHVLRDIETEINLPIFGEITKGNNGYAVSTYIDSKNREYPFYYMTKKAFTLLVMGFTGAKASQFKRQYIDAFETIVDSHRQVTATASKLLEDNIKLKEEAKAREQALLPKTRETLDKTRKIHFDKIEQYFISKGENPEVFKGMLIRSYMLLHLLVIGDIPANIVKDRIGDGVQSINSSHKNIRVSDCLVAINFYTNEEMELFNETLLPTLKSMSDAISTNKQLTPRILADSLDTHLMNQLMFKRNIKKGDPFQGKNRVGLNSLVERLVKKELTIEDFTLLVLELRDGRSFKV